MGHRAPDPDHHPGVDAATYQADEIDAEDAAHSAPDQIHSGEVQEEQLARSSQSCHERGNQRDLQERGLESYRRVSTDADSAAFPVRLLQDAVRRNRSSPCPLALDQGSFRRRSAVPVAHLHGGHDADYAANDATGWHGSSPAKDDEHHDAFDDGLHLLPSAGRAELVLLA